VKKVGIEGIPFFGNLSGVGQYSKSLVESASKQSEDLDFEIVRQWWLHRMFKPPIQPNQHLKYRLVRWMPPIIYYQAFKRTGLVPPYDLVALREYDAFIFFNFISFPLRKKTPSLVVIYDLSFIYHPEFASPRNLAAMVKFVPESIRSSSKVITISQNSKKEITDYYKVEPSKIEVINPAVDHNIFKRQSAARVAAIKTKYGIRKPYILSVCTLEPRKNLIGVLDAFSMLDEDIKEKYALVLVGGKGWLDDELQAKFNKLSKKYDLVKTGYVPDEDLPALYSGAQVFAYPSFYEGFGMPPLEAMACGTPVITSNNSSLPEVVGDAAISIDANDTKRLSKEIQRVLNDNILSGEMIKKGLVQAKKFDWDTSAIKLINLIEEVAK
jgi:glycosyltransferase involved in cell wall biosynthesis